MVEIFKTNVATKKQAKVILSRLSKIYPELKINFDLDDCDRILRVEGITIGREKIAELVTLEGFTCEILEYDC